MNGIQSLILTWFDSPILNILLNTFVLTLATLVVIVIVGVSLRLKDYIRREVRA